MLKLEPGVANPWDYKRLEDFLFFLCPECTYQTQDGDEFIRLVFSMKFNDILTKIVSPESS